MSRKTIRMLVGAVTISTLIIWWDFIFPLPYSDRFGEWLAPVDDWMMEHDVVLDLITVWSMTIGFLIAGLAKTFAWYSLRGTIDATNIGISLKNQKKVEALLFFGMSILYGLTLYGYYISGGQFDFWQKLGLRIFLTAVMIAIVIYSLTFSYWIRRESTFEQEGVAPLAETPLEEETGNEGL